MLTKLLCATAAVGLLTLAPYSVTGSGVEKNNACAAAAGGICTDYGCVGGDSKCVTLPSGALCWTTIIIRIDEPVPADDFEI